MRAMVNGEPLRVFDETPAEHQRRVHSGAKAGAGELAELEERFREKFIPTAAPSRLQLAFEHRHVVLAVVHAETLEQTAANVRIARDAGTDGVFLINHGMADERLLEIHGRVTESHPDWWVGVNCLGLTPQAVFAAISDSVDGVWVDNALIDESQSSQPDAIDVLRVRQERGWRGLYFGGVAFKYQRPVKDLERSCSVAARYVDVVTTSGPGTGQAAPLDKIRKMKSALYGAPLAIASGITPDNIGDYLPYADAFLVATGISRSFTELDAQKARALVARVRAH